MFGLNKPKQTVPAPSGFIPLGQAAQMALSGAEAAFKAIRENGQSPIVRNQTAAPIPLSDPTAFQRLFGPHNEGVSPERAMAQSAFYRCVFLIAGSIAMLNLNVFKVNAADGHREKDNTSPASKLISQRPNGRMSCSMMWRTVVSDMLTHGNGIVYIERDRNGTPLNLYPVPWLRTGITLRYMPDLRQTNDPSGVDRPPNAEMTQVYTLTLDDGRFVIAHQDDVLHIPGSPRWEIFRAMSPLTAYAMSVGIALSADAFAKSYFDNGSSPDGYISYPAGLAKGKDQADEIRTYWHERFGGRNRFGGPAVLTEGGKYELIPATNAVDAQLLEARKFSVSDIGRIFGVPAHMLNETDKASSFGKGLEEMTQSFIDFTLGPHLKAIEDELNYKLVRQSTKIAEFDREGFVRGDLLSRMQAFQIALGGAQGPGIMTQNEARQKANLGRSKDENADKLVTWPSSPATTVADAGGNASPEKDAPEPGASPPAGKEPVPAPAPAKPNAPPKPAKKA